MGAKTPAAGALKTAMMAAIKPPMPPTSISPMIEEGSPVSKNLFQVYEAVTRQSRSRMPVLLTAPASDIRSLIGWTPASGPSRKVASAAKAFDRNIGLPERPNVSRAVRFAIEESSESCRVNPLSGAIGESSILLLQNPDFTSYRENWCSLSMGLSVVGSISHRFVTNLCANETNGESRESKHQSDSIEHQVSLSVVKNDTKCQRHHGRTNVQA